MLHHINMNTVRATRSTTQSYMQTVHFTQARHFKTEEEAKKAIITNSPVPVAPRQVAIGWWVLEVGEIKGAERRYVRSVWEY